VGDGGGGEMNQFEDKKIRKVGGTIESRRS